MILNDTFNESGCMAKILESEIGCPHGNSHIPYQGTFEDDFPFPKVGYVSSRRVQIFGTKRDLQNRRGIATTFDSTHFIAILKFGGVIFWSLECDLCHWHIFMSFSYLLSESISSKIWMNGRSLATTPLKLTSHLPGGHPKRKLVFQPPIFRCQVSFRGDYPIASFKSTAIEISGAKVPFAGAPPLAASAAFKPAT